MSKETYTTGFYGVLREGAAKSAEAIVPLVLQLLPVRSVVDVGCGDGTWLTVFRELGVKEILGVDGEYVEREVLRIPQVCFRAADLSKPFHLDRVFDLAVSLEVAEHLPPESAAVFVESLTRLAPLILFSAAIPSQGGAQHINEQWPDVWARRFQKHGYLPVDCIRKRVWRQESVEFWYAQNTLLFAQASVIENNPALKAEFDRTNPDQLCLVHPRLYLEGRDRQAAAWKQQLSSQLGVREASRLLLHSLKNALKRRLVSVLRDGASTVEDRNTASVSVKD